MRRIVVRRPAVLILSSAVVTIPTLMLSAAAGWGYTGVILLTGIAVLISTVTSLLEGYLKGEFAQLPALANVPYGASSGAVIMVAAQGSIDYVVLGIVAGAIGGLLWRP